jgi:hypothetical protein
MCGRTGFCVYSRRVKVHGDHFHGHALLSSATVIYAAAFQRTSLAGPIHFDVRSGLNRSICVTPQTANPVRTVRLDRGCAQRGDPFGRKGEIWSIIGVCWPPFQTQISEKRRSTTEIKLAQQSGPCRPVWSVHGHKK